MQKCFNNISTILSMYRSSQLLTLSSSPTSDRCTNVSLSQSHTQLPTCQYSYSKNSLSIGRYLNYSFNNCLLHSIQPLCQKSCYSSFVGSPIYSDGSSLPRYLPQRPGLLPRLVPQFLLQRPRRLLPFQLHYCARQRQ